MNRCFLILLSAIAAFAQSIPSGGGGSAVNVNQIGGTNIVTGGVNGSQGVGGLAAVGATAAGNPVLGGGIFNTTPATLTTGQAGALQLSSTQDLLVKVNAALPTGANVIGAVTQSGTWNVAVNAALPTGANVIGAVTQSGTWNVGISAGTSLMGTTLPKTACGTTVYNSGPTNVPNSLTALTATDTCVEAIYCQNIDTTTHTLTVTDASTACNSTTCNLIPPARVFTALESVRFPAGYVKAVGGVKWQADALNKLTCWVEGLQ